MSPTIKLIGNWMKVLKVVPFFCLSFQGTTQEAQKGVQSWMEMEMEMEFVCIRINPAKLDPQKSQG